MVSFMQVLILQTHWRRWLAQKFVSALKAERQKRLEWEKQVYTVALAYCVDMWRTANTSFKCWSNWKHKLTCLAMCTQYVYGVHTTRDSPWPLGTSLFCLFFPLFFFSSYSFFFRPIFFIRVLKNQHIMMTTSYNTIIIIPLCTEWPV